ncbi:Uncharacterised protein [uncultured Clostridium sp.]|nr:Uncharacterised protein [uncultured Clostridium sp.]
MKNLKLDHDEMTLLKEIAHKYSKESEDKYYRLINTSITEEENKTHATEKKILDKLISKLDKK